MFARLGSPMKSKKTPRQALNADLGHYPLFAVLATPNIGGGKHPGTFRPTAICSGMSEKVGRRHPGRGCSSQHQFHGNADTPGRVRRRQSAPAPPQFVRHLEQEQRRKANSQQWRDRTRWRSSAGHRRRSTRRPGVVAPDGPCNTSSVTLLVVRSCGSYPKCRANRSVERRTGKPQFPHMLFHGTPGTGDGPIRHRRSVKESRFPAVGRNPQGNAMRHAGPVPAICTRPVAVMTFLRSGCRLRLRAGSRYPRRQPRKRRGRLRAHGCAASRPRRG